MIDFTLPVGYHSKMVYRLIRQLRRILFVLKVLTKQLLRESFPRRARSLILSFSALSITYKENMTAILAPGALATLTGLDANGLVTTQFPAIPSWTSSDTNIFTVEASPDGLTAKITPTGAAGLATINVVAGSLTASVDVEFQVVAPPTPGMAVTMSIQLSQLPAADAAA